MQQSFLSAQFNAHFPIMTAAHALPVAGPSRSGQPHSGDIL